MELEIRTVKRDTLVANGRLVGVCVDRENTTPIEVPAALREAIETYEGRSL